MKKYTNKKNEGISIIEHIKNVPGYVLAIGIIGLILLPITVWWLYENYIKPPPKNIDSEN